MLHYLNNEGIYWGFVALVLLLFGSLVAAFASFRREQKAKGNWQKRAKVSAIPLKGVTLLSRSWVKVRKAWDDGKKDSASHNGADHEK